MTADIAQHLKGEITLQHHGLGAEPRTSRRFAGGLLVVAVFGLTLWMALCDTPKAHGAWLLPSLCFEILGVIIALSRLYPRHPRQLSLLVLACFALFCLDVTAGVPLGTNSAAGWSEAALNYLGLLVLGLILSLATTKSSHIILRLLIIGAGWALTIAAIVTFTSPGGVTAAFAPSADGWRLVLVGRDAEATAACALMLLWPLVWLAVDPNGRTVLRGCALGAVFGLVSVAVLARSEAAWLCLALTAVCALLFFPARLRAVVWLLVPSVLMVWAFPGLNDYAVNGPAAMGARPVVFILIVGAALSTFIGVILAALESWIDVSLRLRVGFTGLVVAALVAAAIYGGSVIQNENGAVGPWLQHRLLVTIGVASEAPGDAVQLTGGEDTYAGPMADAWGVARQASTHAHWTGIGTGSLEAKYYRERTSSAAYPPGAASWFFRVLAENGVPGVAFVCVFIVLAVAAAAWPRFAAAWRVWRTSWLVPQHPPRGPGRWTGASRDYGWPFSLALAGLYWAAHGAVRPVWESPAAFVLGLLLLGAGVAYTDVAAGVIWARPARLRPSRADDQTESEYDTDRHPGPQASTEIAPGAEAAGAEAAEGVVTGATTGNLPQPEPLRPASRPERPLQTAGRLSRLFRAGLAGVAALLCILCLVPFVEASLETAAERASDAAPARALSYARAAITIMPSAPEPYLTSADICLSASLAVLAEAEHSRYAAAADNQCLALLTLERGAKRLGESWHLWYQTGLAATRLAALVDAHAGQIALYGVGKAPGSLATSPEDQALCAELLREAPAAIRERARGYLEQAQARNPLEPAISVLLTQLAERQ